MSRPKLPFISAFVALAALIASIVRWWIQGSHNLYTAFEKRFYVPDVDLNWRVSSAHPIWLGLDACALVAALAVVLIVAGSMISRREAKHGARAAVLRAIAWTIGAMSLAVPIAGYASGSRPAGAQDILPAELATDPTEDVIAGGLEAPSGRYEVIAHEGTSITAHLAAGGEPFDARFSGDVRGFWQGDPHDLNQLMTAQVSVAAASVDTGVRERSQHARNRYLEADKFPRIEVALERLLAARQVRPNVVAFRARGTLTLIGRTHEIVVTGLLSQIDQAARARLGLVGSILLVKATFSIAVESTALAAHRKTFDSDSIPISISLVLRHVGD